MLNPCDNGLLNCSDILGRAIVSISTNVSGSLFLTLLAAIVIIIAIALMFGIRLEYTAILILPLLLGLMTASGDFAGIGIVILIYLAIILTLNFILK